MLSDRELLAAVKQAAENAYIVYGELGRTDEEVALLAREKQRDILVVLMVQDSVSAEGETELAVEVREELDARVPGGGSTCPACQVALRPWVRFCTRCGFDIAGRAAGPGNADRAMVRAAVREAMEAEFELLGEIARKEGGGDVFFARERATGRIVALRISQGTSADEFDLDETRVVNKLSASPNVAPPTLAMSQIVRRLELATPVPESTPFTTSWRARLAIAERFSKRSFAVPMFALVIAGVVVVVAVLLAIVLTIS